MQAQDYRENKIQKDGVIVEQLSEWEHKGLLVIFRFGRNCTGKDSKVTSKNNDTEMTA